MRRHDVRCDACGKLLAVLSACDNAKTSAGVRDGYDLEIACPRCKKKLLLSDFFILLLDKLY